MVFRLCFDPTFPDVFPEAGGLLDPNNHQLSWQFIGFGALEVTKPYEFIGFGGLEVTKPCEFIGFGGLEVTKPYEFIGFGAAPFYGHPDVGVIAR